MLNGQFAYSREFYGYVNKEQIIRKDTLIPENVWDQINLGIMGPWDPKPEPEIPITTDGELDDIDLGLLELPPPRKHMPQ